MSITKITWIADESGNQTNTVTIVFDDGTIATAKWPGDNQYSEEIQAWLDAGNTIADLPPPAPPIDFEAQAELYSVMKQGEDLLAQDDIRREIGSQTILTDRPAFEQWLGDMHTAYDANGTAPIEPPPEVRQVIALPGDVVGQCVITWAEVTGTWPGWGFTADFRRDDITALGLKVYDFSGAYLYALAFQAAGPGQWITETPPGFALPDKTTGWQFEVIAGSAPVTPKVKLDNTKDYVSFVVRWQPGQPVGMKADIPPLPDLGVKA